MWTHRSYNCVSLKKKLLKFRDFTYWYKQVLALETLTSVPEVHRRLHSAYSVQQLMGTEILLTISFMDMIHNSLWT